MGGRACPGGHHEGLRRLGAVEVVHVDDVRRGLAALRETLGVADDVVLDHHLLRSGDEDMEARLTRGKTERERAARDRADQLEETAALERLLGQDRGIGIERDELRRDPERLPPLTGRGGLVCLEPGAHRAAVHRGRAGVGRWHGYRTYRSPNARCPVGRRVELALAEVA